MLGHRYNTHTKYEFAIKNAQGETVYTLWLVAKRMSHVHKLLAQNNWDCLSSICRKTNTRECDWSIDHKQGTVDCGEFVGRFTGETLFQKHGYKD